MMKFSVLTSLYGKEKAEYLRQSLNSVFNQSLPPDEVVLVEDGPLTDELYDILNKFEIENHNIKRIKLSKNLGLGSALNEGLKYCSYDIVARMDTDDICFPYRFERQIAYMISHPDVVASGSWVEEFENIIENPVAVKKVPSSYEKIKEYSTVRNPLNHPSVIFRKKAIEAVGGYKHFPLFEDWYLWVRLLANGYKLGNIEESLVHFRISSEMYKRRGGWVYSKDSFRFQLELYRLGLISLPKAITSGILRGVVYLLPNNLRSLVYKKLLRR